MSTAINKQVEIESLLKSFNLISFINNYQQYARLAEKEKLDYVSYLYQLAKVESEERHHRKTERLLKQSKLPPSKNLSEFDTNALANFPKTVLKELISGDCLDQAENVLIFGNPGTGKTHLAAGLGRQWCLSGRAVYFTSASALVQDLLVAKRDLKLNNFLAKLDKFQAVIIDDISYIPQNREETDVLFVLLADRYEHKSIVITSNLPFSQWDKIFKDTVTTGAAIDRLVHHSHILQLNGESYRAKTAGNVCVPETTLLNQNRIIVKLDDQQ